MHLIVAEILGEGSSLPCRDILETLNKMKNLSVV